MHKLYDIKDMLMEQLEKDADEGHLTPETLKEIDTLAHALKNLNKVIECCEDEEYSGRYYSREDRGMSGRRGRDRMGRYTSRDEGPDADADGRSMDERSMDGRSMRSMAGGNTEQVIRTLENYLHTDADERTRGRVRELIRDMRNA